MVDEPGPKLDALANKGSLGSIKLEEERAVIDVAPAATADMTGTLPMFTVLGWDILGAVNVGSASLVICTLSRHACPAMAPTRTRIQPGSLGGASKIANRFPAQL